MNTRDLSTAYRTPRLVADGAGGLGPAQRIERPPEVPPEAQWYLRLRRYMVDKRYYGHQPGAPTRPPPRGSLPDPEDPNCWNLDEVNDAEFDNLLFFTRVYSSIPRSWTETGSTNVALPAFDDPETLAAAKTITAITANNASDRQTLTSSAHGYSAGEIAFLNLAFIGVVRNGPNKAYHIATNLPVLSTTTDTFDANLGPIVGYKVNVLGPATAQKLTGYPLRPIRNRFVPTTVQHDYFLPGITHGIRTRDDIPLLQQFTIQRGPSNGDDWPDNTLNASTIPTAAQYWAAMQARTRLILDSTLVDVRLPLIDRRTISYAAQ